MTTARISTEHLNTIADRLSCDKEDQVNQRRHENKNRANTIINIIEIVPNKVAKVVFYDGTIEKVVCDEDDTFSLEMAITICMAKKLYGGTAAYNKAVRDGMKIYKRMLERKQNEKEERERIAKKKQKRKEYLARREARKREEQIEIQKEAYVRAMRELNDASTVARER